MAQQRPEVVIVGGGIMGGDIAIVFAANGWRVRAAPSGCWRWPICWPPNRFFPPARRRIAPRGLTRFAPRTTRRAPNG